MFNQKFKKLVSSAVLGAFVATTGSILFPVSALAAPRYDHRPPVHRIHHPNPPRHIRPVRPIRPPRPIYVHHRDHRRVVVVHKENRTSNAEVAIAVLGILGNIIASKNANES